MFVVVVVVVVVVVSLFWLGPPLGFFERVYLNYRTCDAYDGRDGPARRT